LKNGEKREEIYGEKRSDMIGGTSKIYQKNPELKLASRASPLTDFGMPHHPDTYQFRD
jgi:hypothetical protein